MSLPPEGGQCPICGRPRDVKFRPFCSKICADIDLMRWLNYEYSIPGAPQSEENITDPYEDDDAG